MDPREEQELEESLEYMRKKFQALTDDIKVPDSLRADLLKKQLELMEAEEEEREVHTRRRKRHARSKHKPVVIPFRTAVSLAACVVVVSVSFLSFQLGRAAGGGLEAVSSAPMADAQAAPAAMPMEAEAPEAQSIEEAGAFDEGMEGQEALGAPVPGDFYNAPLPDETSRPSSPETTPMPQARLAAEPENAPMPQNTGAGEEGPESAPQARTASLTPDNDGWEAYLPQALPEGLSLAASAQGEDSLSVSYLNDDYSRQIQLTLRPITAGVEANLVDPGAPETYDLRLYPQPYADSVPEELAPMLNAPVFRQEDLTTSMVEARVFSIDGGSQARGNFSILFPSGVVAELNVTGVPASEVYAMIASMNL